MFNRERDRPRPAAPGRPYVVTGVLACALAAGVIAQPGPAHVPRTPDAQPSAGLPDPAAAWRSLNDARAPWDRRVVSAESLLEAASSAEARGAITTAIAGIRGDSDAGVAVLDAIARRAVAPRWVWAALSEAWASAPSSVGVRFIHAAASFRSRPAARMLLDRAVNPGTPLERAAAYGALARLSGRDDLSTDLDSWKAWVTAAEKMDEAQWQATLVASLAARSDERTQAEQRLSERLLQALRRLHLATPENERSALLAGMLEDRDDKVRALGFELASRELSSSRFLSPRVGELAVALLRDERPSVRASAALLVSQMNPPNAREQVLEALAMETHPEPATAILQASLRWPGRVWFEPVLEWLHSGTSATAAAADGAWALVRAGHVTGPDREKLLDAVRSLPPAAMNLSACRTLVELGTDEDRRDVAALMRSPIAVARVAAAEALVADEPFASEIAAAARADPQLFPAAVRATAMYRADREGYLTLASLPADSDPSRRRALLGVAELLPAPDLLVIAAEARLDLQYQESLLSFMASRARWLSERSNPDSRRAIQVGVVRLAEARIALDRPDGALAALDSCPELPETVDARSVPHLRALALICLDRPEDSAAQAAPVSVWLDGLERCLKKPFAPTLADLLEAKFAGVMSVDDAVKLAMLRASLPETPRPPVPEEFVGPLLPATR